jgi:hypothetical protein
MQKLNHFLSVLLLFGLIFWLVVVDFIFFINYICIDLTLFCKSFENICSAFFILVNISKFTFPINPYKEKLDTKIYKIPR